MNPVLLLFNVNFNDLIDGPNLPFDFLDGLLRLIRSLFLFCRLGFCCAHFKLDLRSFIHSWIIFVVF